MNTLPLAEACLSLSKAFWQLIEPLPEPAFLIDSNARIILANARARHRFGLTTTSDPDGKTTPIPTAGEHIAPNAPERNDDASTNIKQSSHLPFETLFRSAYGSPPDEFLRQCRRSRTPVPGMLKVRALTGVDEQAAAGFRVDARHCLIVLTQGYNLSHHLSHLNEELTRAKALSRALHDERARARRSAYRFQTTLETLKEGVISTDPQFRVDFANTAALDLLGLTELPFAESLSRLLIAREPQTDALAVFDDPEAQPPSCALRLSSAGGRITYVQISRRPLHDPVHGSKPMFNEDSSIRSLRGWLFVLRDITDEYASTQQLAFEASHDHLTGVHNRRHFEHALREVINRIQTRSQTRSAQDDDPTHVAAPPPAPQALTDGTLDSSILLFLDLDQFKLVNDTLGHHVGDALLRAIADTLTIQITSPKVVSRFGGDEFAIIAHGIPHHEIDAFAHCVARIIDEVVLVWDSVRVSLSASIGGVVLDDHGHNVNDALRKADLACYRAKREGRGRIVWYTPAIEHATDAPRPHFGMVNRLRKALSDARLPLHLQRIETLVPGLPDHHEVLLRLDDAEGFAGPGEFLPVAEAHGLMPEIDLYVVHNALQLLLAAQQGDIPDLDQANDRLCVNLSGQTLNDAHAIAEIEQLIAANSAVAGRMAFEITETSALRSPGDLSALIQRLGRYGVEFALDDFGSGYSSFQYLRQIPAQMLKIDGQFVRDLHRDSIDRTLVRSLTDIAHSLGKKVIAEFVENQQICDLLRVYGVEYAQGYYIDKPHPIVGFTATGKP